MKKLYTEGQYKEYTHLMDRLSNVNNTLSIASIHRRIQQWLASNGLHKQAELQMGKRMRVESLDESCGIVRQAMIVDFNIAIKS